MGNGTLESEGSAKDLQQTVSNGGLEVNPGPKNGSISAKKTKEIERRRRRRKQKKKNRAANGTQSENDSEGEEEQYNDKDEKKFLGQVEVEYVAEKANIEDELLEDFKRVFHFFSLGDSIAGGQKDDDVKEDAASNLAAKKKFDSDSDEEDEQETQTKERGVSNKKKKASTKNENR